MKAFFNRSFLLLLVLLLSGQSLIASLTIRSHHLNTTDGLSHNTVRGIIQDSRGFIWVPTLSGLSRYDGYRFQHYLHQPGVSVTLADNRIQSVQEDLNGYLWIVTGAQKMSCYDLLSGKYADFTGKGELEHLYSKFIIDSRRQIWMWHSESGCLKSVSQSDRSFRSSVFRSEAGSLSDNHIRFICEDTAGEIWIGTRNGLNRVDPAEKTTVYETGTDFFQAVTTPRGTYFVSYQNTLWFYDNDSRKLEKVLDFNASSSGQKPTGTYWYEGKLYILTTMGSGCYDPADRTYSQETFLPEWLVSGEVVKDNRGNLLLYNNTGRVVYLDVERAQMRQFTLMPAQKVRFIDSERFHVVRDSRGITWISTYGNGLFAYEWDSEQLHHFSREQGADLLSSDYLLSLTEDRSGTLWVGSEYTGLTRISIQNNQNKHLFPEDPGSYNRSNTVRMLSWNPDSTLTIATRLGALYVYDLHLDAHKTKQPIPANIYAGIVTRDQDRWLGSRGDGVCHNGTWYRHDPSDSSSLSNNHVYSLLEDSRGRIWIGTFGGGLNLAIRGKNTYRFGHYLRDGFNQGRIRTLLQLKNKRIIAGTNEGFYLFHPDSLLQDPKARDYYSRYNSDFPASEIRTIFQDSNERIWLGTAGDGLIRVIPGKDGTTPEFQKYTTANGLVNNGVQSIEEDRDGNLWIATEYGISRLYPGKMIFENHLFSNNPVENVYTENCSLAAADGRILFGTMHGLEIVTPEGIDRHFSRSTLTLTGIQINGVVPDSGIQEALSQSPFAPEQPVSFGHNQNSLTLFFSAMQFDEPTAVRYSCKLENLDTGWSEASSQHFCSYKDLPAGSYRFLLRCCSPSGIWEPEQELCRFEIRHPWWLTWPAWLTYLLCVSLLGVFLWRMLSHTRQLRHRISMEKELTDYKLRFFTNISHEFRTPLTLILGSLEQLRRNASLPQEVRHPVELMNSNSSRLLRLVDQLLTFRKMQHGKLVLRTEPTELVPFMNAIFQSFAGMAQSTTTDYLFSSDERLDTIVWIDRDKVDKILYNLLSNAFKYTPPRGHIHVRLLSATEPGYWVLEVEDSGRGIPEERRKELFDRFMQVNYTGDSFGIGLHLTHELVTLHKGRIGYDPVATGGSLFRVILPGRETSYLESERSPLESEYKDADLVEGPAIADPCGDSQPLTLPEPMNDCRILVVEDDLQIRHFIRDELARYFKVELACDGEEGWQKVVDSEPDLIISDVMMPRKNGFELVRQLKQDFRTCHIPVVLLTALHSAEKRMEGADCGADAYIAKPFAVRHLLIQSIRLIEQRQQLREKFAASGIGQRATICSQEKDRLFISRVERIMEERMEDPLFSVDAFAAEMELGRTVFYRKIKGLIGSTPNEYIRSCRMKRAVELLENTTLPIAEVAEKVGIPDQFYFSKCFKEQFGMPPSRYQKGG